MLKLIKKLLGVPPNPDPTGLVVAPANIPVPEVPTVVAPPYTTVQLVTERHVLRRLHTDHLVLAGTTMKTKNGQTITVGSGKQQPPYVRVTMRGRPLAIKPETISCYWGVVHEPIQ